MRNVMTLTLADGQQISWRALRLPRRGWDRWIRRHVPRGTNMSGAVLDVFPGGRR
jgi:hypothetical protein